jgi:hypothetical protein
MGPSLIAFDLFGRFNFAGRIPASMAILLIRF